MKKLLILAFLITLFIPKIYSQEYYELEDMFLDADSWFFYEDYEEALPLFLRVLEADSMNHNVMYKIGFCYLHIQGQKAKSIPYLEQAINRTNPNYRNNNYNEKRAPVDALFYLGNAYLINNQIDAAIDAYTGFQNAITRIKRLADKDIYDAGYLKRQFDACRNAIQLKYDPISFIASNAGNKINTRFNEFNAVVSGDGNTMVYTASLQFYDAIYYTKKTNGEWSYPINIMGQLGVDDKSASTGLSYDGTELYIYRDDNFDGNIYVSFLKDNIWSTVRKLGPNINTKYWESHASISPDNQTLYFTSNREDDGYGDLDIYMSKRLSDTTWAEPINLGEKINTEWNENAPFLAPDGRNLFFSSEGHNGMGGYDIYYSTFQGDSTWSEPVNIGYPINTTDDDVFFVPFEKGQFAYCSQFSKKGFGGQDIYHFQVFNIPQYSNIVIEGVLTLDNETDRNKESFVINVVDKLNQDTIISLNPDKDKSEYETVTPLGKNHLVYESPMSSETGSQYYISSDYDIREVFRSEIERKRLEEIEKERARLAKLTSPEINLEKNTYTTDKNKNVKIKLALEKGNKLIVKTFYKGDLINTEEFEIEKEDFTYEHKPQPGESKIEFLLVDQYNNIKSEEVTVRYAPKDNIAELSIKDQQSTIDSNGDKKVKINLKTERNSNLVVETYVDGKLINSESFKVKKRNFEYEYEPKHEKSTLKFILTDKHNNVNTEEILISHKPTEDDLVKVLTEIKSFDNKTLNSVLQSNEVLSASTADELINQLYIKAKDFGLNENQVQALIVALASDLDKDTPSFISKLQEIAQGDLKVVLDSIQANQGNYKTNMDVINELVNQTKNYNYNHKDIIKLLEKYIIESDVPANDIIKKLNELLKSEISNILEELDSSAIDIVSINDLKEHIKNLGIYSNEELEQIFTLLDALLISSKASNENETTVSNSNEIKTNEEKNNLLVIYLVTIGIFLGIFIIFLTNRRKRKKRK